MSAVTQMRVDGVRENEGVDGVRENEGVDGGVENVGIDGGVGVDTAGRNNDDVSTKCH